MIKIDDEFAIERFDGKLQLKHITYCNANDIKSFQNNVKFARVV